MQSLPQEEYHGRYRKAGENKMNSHSDHTLHFEAVNSRNRAEVEHLEVFAEQSGFIESVTQCLQEADKLELWTIGSEADRRRCWRPVGVYDGDALIGFAMYGFFWEYLPFGRLWLDRLLIDKKYQGKGYGKRVVLALLDRLRTEYSCDTIYLSVYETNSHAIHLYQQIGFHFNGEYDTNGEHVMVYAF